MEEIIFLGVNLLRKRIYVVFFTERKDKSVWHISDCYISLILDVVNDINLLPTAKLKELVHLAEMCVNLIRENNEYYAEVRNDESDISLRKWCRNVLQAKIVHS